jgi:polyisoprenoid-binding protein YceI
MKNMKILGLLLVAGTLSVSAQKSEININKSVGTWTANKIGGSHNGGIKIQSGYVEFKKADIVGGEIVMAMNSITNSDLKDDGYNQKLVGHLKSEDFFAVEKYPTSTFKITNASIFKDGKATLTGILTIKGKSEDISFDVTKKDNTYSSQLKIDRSKFDIRYGSKSFFDNLGDKVIDDIFLLDIQLVF